MCMWSCPTTTYHSGCTRATSCSRPRARSDTAAGREDRWGPQEGGCILEMWPYRIIATASDDALLWVLEGQGLLQDLEMRDLGVEGLRHLIDRHSKVSRTGRHRRSLGLGRLRADRRNSPRSCPIAHSVGVDVVLMGGGGFIGGALDPGELLRHLLGRGQERVRPALPGEAGRLKLVGGGGGRQGRRIAEDRTAQQQQQQQQQSGRRKRAIPVTLDSHTPHPLGRLTPRLADWALCVYEQ